MRSRKIYMLLVVLGLAMVWLGFLFVYELKIVQKGNILTEQLPVEQQYTDAPAVAERLQITGAGADHDINEAGTGFPIALAGIGLVLVVSGASRFRHRRKKLV